ncbi:MAG: SurA N-terminal domain-containing protein, partial [Pseudomonadota bacterium]
MLTSFRTNKVFAWSMMVILIAAMAGFGLGGVLSGGQVTHVARVGDERISVERFVTAFRERQRQVSQQIGQPLSTIEARQFGLGNVVIGELVRDAALTAEAKALGLGISDEIIQRSLLSQPAFQSITGGFDPEMYEFALQNADLTTGQYEAQLRDQAQRELVGTALASGVAIPQAAIDQILAYTGEARSFTTVRLSLEVFLDEVTAPSDEQLATFLADNPSLFEVPETRDVVYAALSLERLAESIDIPLSEVEPIYEADRARFQTPERRAVDRISFPSRADAETALQQLSDGTLTVAQIAQDRGLTPQDLTLGLVTPSDLPRAEREAVFGAESVGIIGPIETDLGPVLFVINAVLAAQETPRDEALDTLRAELAFEEAQDLAIEDLLRAEELVAGGATVEEIVETTAFELAQAEVTAFGATGPHADVVPFRDAAMAADLG